MAKLIFDHSNEEWMEKLTVPEQELSLSERDAIATHVVACLDCSRIVTENALLKRFIQAIPAPAIPPGLPLKLLQIWQEEDRNSTQKPMQEAENYRIVPPAATKRDGEP